MSGWYAKFVAFASEIKALSRLFMTRFTLGAAAVATAIPARVDPLSETIATSGCDEIQKDEEPRQRGDIRASGLLLSED